VKSMYVGIRIKVVEVFKVELFFLIEIMAHLH